LQSFTDAVEAIEIVKRSPVDKRIVKEKGAGIGLGLFDMIMMMVDVVCDEE
jgi:hypothetical protein